jgi:anti-sigma regulatory factor (Ser/Thr protein kinase)
MDLPPLEHHEFPILGRGYFLGGRASTTIKNLLAAAGVEDAVIQRATVATYEAEMNVVLHATSGVVELDIFADRVLVKLHDRGPGIADLELAMTQGWSTASSEARGLGFGAGMGLPNIKAQTDDMQIESRPGQGVRLTLTFLRPGATDSRRGTR